MTRNLVLGPLVAILPFSGMRVIYIDAPGATTIIPARFAKVSLQFDF